MSTTAKRLVLGWRGGGGGAGSGGGSGSGGNGSSTGPNSTSASRRQSYGGPGAGRDSPGLTVLSYGSGGGNERTTRSRLLPGGGGVGGGGGGLDHELDEIAVVSCSNADPGHVKYGSGPLSTLNGPRVVPGIITSGGVRMVGERLSSSGTHLDKISSPVQCIVPGIPGSLNHHRASQDSIHRAYSTRQSLLDLVSCKLGMSRGSNNTSARPTGTGTGLPPTYAAMMPLGGPTGGNGHHHQQQRYFSVSHDSISTTGGCATSYARAANVNTAASELDLSRKGAARRKDLRGRLKLPSNVSALGAAHSGEAPLLGGAGGGWRTTPGSMAGTNPPSSNHLNSTSSCNGTERYGFRRGESINSRLRPGASNWSFVFDPAGRLCYYWSMVVSLAFLYNFWVIIYRFAFQEINRETILVWFCLDYFTDFLYLVDIMFHFRTGYLEDGVLQTDAAKLRNHYMNSTTFYIDCLCLLPLDFLYLSIGFNSILRSFRLVKIYRFWAFMDRTERHTNYPNLFRSCSLIHYLMVIFHWNACLFHIIHKNNGFGSKNWVYGDAESGDVVKQYLQSYYWCTLALTTIGDLPRPRNKGEYLFVIVQLLFGLMLFATVLGHVANIVTSVSAARKEFQAKLDGVKTYMRMRRVPNHLQVKVIKWFDYLWLTQKCSDEERAVSCLPDKLKAEIAINVHLDTLKRVEIFQNTEAGFLCELVLRLRPVLFSPGDYICRKGEVGKEMYIVNRGRLQVVADNGRTVLATLKAGSYFGEISILNMGTAGKLLGNRRTASVRSVGYSDLFVLSKKDMWDVLKEYPAARVRLEAIAVKRLEKYKRAPLEKAAMGRSQSTPGLVESRGKVPLEEMWLPGGCGGGGGSGAGLMLGLLTATTTCSSGYEPSCRSLLSTPPPPHLPPALSLLASMGVSGTGGGGVSHQSYAPPPPLPQVPSVVAMSTTAMSSTTTTTFTAMMTQPPPQVLPPPSTSTASYSAAAAAAASLAQLPALQPLQIGRQLGTAAASTSAGYGFPPPQPCQPPPPDSPGSTSSFRSRHHTPGSHGRSGAGLHCDSMTQLVSGAATPLLGSSSSHELLDAEIKRLRERLHTVETENAAMSVKLNQQQWELENRLAEIEMQICGSRSTSSLDDNNERNRESII